MRRPEAMLVCQAHALDGLFNTMVALAYRNNEPMGLEGFERLLRLGLRAQAQCTRTLEVLGNLKNPTQVAFVKQANIAHQQQVNNAGSRAQEKPLPETQLLEQREALNESDAQWLDRRATPATGASHPPLEAVAEVNRLKDTGR